MAGMKVRDSGMPEQSYWETLFDVPGILDRLQVNGTIESAVEVGCGYGTFTLPVAQRLTGTLHTFDIEPAMIAATSKRLRQAGIRSVKLVERDVLADGFDLPPASVDAVLLFNILHLENPTALLRASADLLRANGRVLVIHWRSDIPTPRGPDLSIRPRPEQIITWAQETGLLSASGTATILPPWHFGLSLRRI
jgi:SAM-dependent methyltransferase